MRVEQSRCRYLTQTDGNGVKNPAVKGVEAFTQRADYTPIPGPCLSRETYFPDRYDPHDLDIFLPGGSRMV